jgi:hypothetical protein
MSIGNITATAGVDESDDQFDGIRQNPIVFFVSFRRNPGDGTLAFIFARLLIRKANIGAIFDEMLVERSYEFMEL